MKLLPISRAPVSQAIIMLDFCSLTFSVSPCLGTGTPCYNTLATCKSKSTYVKSTKNYNFVSADAPLPFRTGERPYITSISFLPTEIKNNLTVTGRVKISFADEFDTDIGIDPYLSQRISAAQGTFWKKLIARNPNYKGRLVKVYEGYLEPDLKTFMTIEGGDFLTTEEDDQLITEDGALLITEYGMHHVKFVGKIENITLDRGSVSIELIDLLKALSKIEIPPKLDVKLAADVDATATQMTLTATTGLDSPAGHIRIGDEIIYYTAIDPITKILSGCTRGYFGTVATSHTTKDKAQKVRYYPPANPFDILLGMLQTDAGYAAEFIDSSAFANCKAWPGGEIDFSAIISEPVKLDKLFFEIVDIVDCKVWIAEELKITIKKNIPNRGGRSYGEITDALHIIDRSSSVDLNEDSRLTRVIFYWDKTALGDVEEPASYGRLDIGIDADAENVKEFGEAIERKFFCRWIRSGYLQEEILSDFVSSLLAQYVRQRREALPLVSFDAEMKDFIIRTGDFLKVSTDELLNVDGSVLCREKFQTVKREKKGNLVRLTTQRMPARKIFIIAPDDMPEWNSASEAQKEYGFICGDDGRMADDTIGYFIY